MTEEDQPKTPKEAPWLGIAETGLAFVVILWLASMVNNDYEHVKNLPITMATVGGVETACVEVKPVDAIMATAWDKLSNWDVRLLGDQYFIMSDNGEVESVWSRSDTLYHFEDPAYNEGDQVCVIFAKQKQLKSGN
ncbi:hypothetical protein KBD69_03380 [Candidatus Woesebacteria bacterium]|nr:hypothetical protein [Candidatus Woesebacteria bacterium]